MFDGYPRYVPGGAGRPRPAPRHTENQRHPKIHSADDMLAIRDQAAGRPGGPRQLLSGCVVDYAVEQLVANNNDPSG